MQSSGCTRNDILTPTLNNLMPLHGSNKGNSCQVELSSPLSWQPEHCPQSQTYNSSVCWLKTKNKTSSAEEISVGQYDLYPRWESVKPCCKIFIFCSLCDAILYCKWNSKAEGSVVIPYIPYGVPGVSWGSFSTTFWGMTGLQQAGASNPWLEMPLGLMRVLADFQTVIR